MAISHSILIVDDEQQSRSLISALLQKYYPNRFLLLEAGTVAEARDIMLIHSPSIIFLDVQMQGETGFNLLNQFPKTDIALIFVTAHSDFAVRAFRYSALDYLLKPIDASEFKGAIEKAIQKLNARQGQLGGQLEQLCAAQQ